MELIAAPPSDRPTWDTRTPLAMSVPDDASTLDGSNAAPRPGLVKLLSFGFKFGLAPANYYFDVSFVRNPARDDRWGMHGVIDPEMVDYVLRQEQAARFVDLVVPLVRHIATLDAHQVVAFGCNAGRHRSPIIATAVGQRLADLDVEIGHRDLPVRPSTATPAS